MAKTPRLDEVLQRLRAAAEPTRLRLLAVCSEGELTVGELCLILEQSQPRISRHLKLLCDGGLLVRFREGHCVYYRPPASGGGAETVRQLLAWMGDSDAQLQRDRAKSSAVRQQRAASASLALGKTASAEDLLLIDEQPSSGVLRELLLKEATDRPEIKHLLDIGTGTGRILKWLAPQARQATGIDISPEALRIARTSVHGAGLSHCVLQQGDMYALSFPAQSFDFITMGRLLADAERPEAALKEAVRVLRPDGCLAVIEDYDRLEGASGTSGRNALAMLRGWLEAAGLDCARLRPVDTDSQHLIVAVGRRRDRLNLAA